MESQILADKGYTVSCFPIHSSLLFFFLSFSRCYNSACEETRYVRLSSLLRVSSFWQSAFPGHGQFGAFVPLILLSLHDFFGPASTCFRSVFLVHDRSGNQFAAKLVPRTDATAKESDVVRRMKTCVLVFPQ
jgi:hypothetical protein